MQSHFETKTLGVSPCLLFLGQWKAREDYFVESLEPTEKHGIAPRCADVGRKEGRELIETVQATSYNHVRQLVLREWDCGWLYSTPAVLQRRHEHEFLAYMTHASPSSSVSTVMTQPRREDTYIQTDMSHPREFKGFPT